ncbi:MAG: hypothetical protein GY820_43230 [Gammaproteobacteria bacterium]|nr:hypothetical protein [Gammaproteobacteria bacterium]
MSGRKTLFEKVEIVKTYYSHGQNASETSRILSQEPIRPGFQSGVKRQTVSETVRKFEFESVINLSFQV